MTTYMLATYGAFGVIGAALFGFGVSVAIERGQGWMRLKRVSPMPPLAYFVAKVVTGAAVSRPHHRRPVRPGRDRRRRAHARRRSGSPSHSSSSPGPCPSRAMGLAFGYLVGPNSAPAVLNLVYLPMAFASGLWIPISQLPALVQSARPLPAAVPFRPARARHLRRLRGRLAGSAPRGARGLHRGVPRRGSLGLPARRRADVRMRRPWPATP